MPTAEICTRHEQSKVSVAIAKAPYLREGADRVITQFHNHHRASMF